LRIGIGWTGQDVVHVSLLDNPAMIHHRHPVTQLTDHTDIMGDDQIGKAELCPQLFQQLQDLRLNGHVERRGRFVADEYARSVDECAGDRHALALAAGQFMRETLCERHRQINLPQEGFNPLANLVA